MVNLNSQAIISILALAVLFAALLLAIRAGRRGPGAGNK
jgi:hypothetical protein